MSDVGEDWKDAVSERIMVMEKTQAELSRHAFGSSSYVRAAGRYEDACLDFLNHIDDVYGSPDDFSDFIRAETRHLVREQKLSAAEVDNMDWSIDDRDDIIAAQSAARLYTENYRAMIDSLAYLRQFRREDQPFAERTSA